MKKQLAAAGFLLLAQGLYYAGIGLFVGILLIVNDPEPWSFLIAGVSAGILIAYAIAFAVSPRFKEIVLKGPLMAGDS